jgi:hypothetical protein
MAQAASWARCCMGRPALAGVRTGAHNTCINPRWIKTLIGAEQGRLKGSSQRQSTMQPRQRRQALQRGAPVLRHPQQAIEPRFSCAHAVLVSGCTDCMMSMRPPVCSMTR